MKFHAKLAKFSTLLVLSFFVPSALFGAQLSLAQDPEITEEINESQSSLEVMNELFDDENTWNEIIKKINESYVAGSTKDPAKAIKLDEELKSIYAESDVIAEKQSFITDLLKSESITDQQRVVLERIQNMMQKEADGIRTTKELIESLKSELDNAFANKTAKKVVRERKIRNIQKQNGNLVVSSGNKVERLLGNTKNAETEEEISMENAGLRAIKVFLDNTKSLGIEDDKFIHFDVSRVRERNGLYFVELSQNFNGLPVDDATSTVVLRKDGSVVSITNNVVFPNTSTSPKITEKRAIKIAKEKIYWNDMTDKLMELKLALFQEKLAYRIQLSTFNPMGEWTVYIDAENGELLNYYNEISFAEYVPVVIKGAVLPKHATSQMEYLPLPKIFVSTKDELFVTDEAGKAILEVLGNFDVTLESPTYIVRTDDEYMPEFSFQPTLDAVEYILDRTMSSLPITNVFYHVGSIENYFASLGQKKNEKQLSVTVNSSLVDAYLRGCGSWYNAKLHTIELGRGGCGNGNFSLSSDVIYHEYAHGAVNSIYYLKNIPGSESGALNEALADYFAVSKNNDPLFGEQSLARVRNIKNNLTLHSDWTGNLHQDSLIISGALWDMREKLGQETADQLIFDALFFYPQSFEDMLYSLILADDNDRNVHNGTPHLQEILNAFNKHGIGPTMDEYKGFEYKTSEPQGECRGSECFMNVSVPGKTCAFSLYKIEQTNVATGAITMYIRNDGALPCDPSTADGNWFVAGLTAVNVETEYLLPAGIVPPGGTITIAGGPFDIKTDGKFAIGTMGSSAPLLRVPPPQASCIVAPSHINQTTAPLEGIPSPCDSQIFTLQTTIQNGDSIIETFDSIDGIPPGYGFAFSEDGITPLETNVISYVPAGPQINTSQSTFDVVTDQSPPHDPVKMISSAILNEPGAGFIAAVNTGVTEVQKLTNANTYLLTAPTTPSVGAVVGIDTVQITALAALPNNTTISIVTGIQATEGGNVTWSTKDYSVFDGNNGINPLVIDALMGTDTFGLGTDIYGASEEGNGVETYAGEGPEPAGTALKCWELPNPDCIPGKSPTYNTIYSKYPKESLGCTPDCKVFLIPFDIDPTLYWPPEWWGETPEPEDYGLFDYGDAPDPFYSTDPFNPSTGWIAHPKNPEGFYLGLVTEGDGKTIEAIPNMVDLDKKDDGVKFISLSPNGTGTIQVEVTVPAGMSPPYYINALADWNRKNAWKDSGEWIIKNLDVSLPPYNMTAGQSRAFIIPITTGQYVSNVWFRFTLSDIPFLNWDGSFTAFPITGETEDYYVEQKNKGGLTGFCGNGIIDELIGEECDPLAEPQFPAGVNPAEKVCSPECNAVDPLLFCGNGIVEENYGEECDPESGELLPENMVCEKIRCKLIAGKKELGNEDILNEDDSGDRFAMQETEIKERIFDSSIIIRGTEGIAFATPHLAGMGSYSKKDLPEILEALIRRNALPESATIDVLPIVMRAAGAEETLFSKIRNYLFENMVEIALVIIFGVALAIDIRKLLPKTRDVQKLFTKKE